MSKLKKNVLFLLIASCALGTSLSNEHFSVVSDGSGVTSLKKVGDPHAPNFIAEGASLGSAMMRYRIGSGQWIDYDSTSAEKKIDVTSHFKIVGDTLTQKITVSNNSDSEIEVGDLAIALPMNTEYKNQDVVNTFNNALFRHSFISGHGSFVFWLPVGGTGTHLVMTPEADTHLEFFKEQRASYSTGGVGYMAYIHSLAESELQPAGTWRQKHTSLNIKPGQKASYAFNYRWADDYQGVRDVLYENGGIDVRIAPGMVVPENLFVKVALRTKNKIDSLNPEYPKQTKVEYLGEKSRDTHIYKIEFAKLGENLVTVEYSGSKHMVLEFFVIQPLETLVKKRAAFIAEKQQYRDTSLWYDGLYSLWDVRNEEGKNLLGPDNLSGQHEYAVSGSDDPSNSKCMYLSEANVAFPNAEQIESLEYFIENFVWGKHQRTDKEIPYPYGIYGSENWKENREATRDPIEEGKSRPGQGGSQCRMWRTFDYTTYFALYYNMYLIAKKNPEMVKYLDADEYLERAYGTVKAFFEVPYNIYMEGGWAFTGWTDWAYTLGNFHEKYMLKIIDALEKSGQQEKADYIRGEWEKKVKYFIYDDPYPFTSEMPVDSTAYESTYAIAKYAMNNELNPDKKLWKNKNTGQWYSHPVIDKTKHAEFMERQLMANLACRGWLEASYYFLGSDFRGLGSSGYTLSYMSQMGGWSVLDYSLYFAEKPEEYLRLGYASMLSSWALVNAGEKESGYGFWYPGKMHDGSVGWGFCPQKVGQEWNHGCWDKDAGGVKRGPWPVCGEIDHGLTAGVEVACTVLLDDPLFGLFAYGGELDEKAGNVNVIPRDGVRRRLHVLVGDTRMHMRFDRDGFAKDKAIIFDKDFSEISFNVESRSKNRHLTSLIITGLKDGEYKLLVDGKKTGAKSVSNGNKVVFDIPVEAAGKDASVIIQKL
ncbi:DUF5695 domain-containing protein [Sedimentisphaera salicampi]|uniref:DUF5695 domain-containing protein n=1 Tax=Sedimentisphaera salicampi TaxID=1941349 RepID=UPI000B9BEB3F|nr:DUF5695 domain-containing protein [Sedimentisphaera salicampi]OXU15737.1 hypothetical protein SMSP1_00526 [Sedimentisphaera salicampi]